MSEPSEERTVCYSVTFRAGVPCHPHYFSQEFECHLFRSQKCVLIVSRQLERWWLVLLLPSSHIPSTVCLHLVTEIWFVTLRFRAWALLFWLLRWVDVAVHSSALPAWFLFACLLWHLSSLSRERSVFRWKKLFFFFRALKIYVDVVLKIFSLCSAVITLRSMVQFIGRESKYW